MVLCLPSRDEWERRVERAMAELCSEWREGGARAALHLTPPPSQRDHTTSTQLAASSRQLRDGSSELVARGDDQSPIALTAPGEQTLSVPSASPPVESRASGDAALLAHAEQMTAEARQPPAQSPASAPPPAAVSIDDLLAPMQASSLRSARNSSSKSGLFGDQSTTPLFSVATLERKPVTKLNTVSLFNDE